MSFFKRIVAAAVCAVLVCFSVARAETVEDFYKDKTVTLVVSAPAGTLTDLIARQFKDYFAKHIPGQPEMIVSNVPGAGGIIAAARLQLQEPEDGTVVAFLQRNNLYLPLVEEGRDGFDPRSVRWLGSLDKVAYAMVVSANSPVKTAEEMFDKRTIVGATGYANDNRTLPVLMNKYMDTKFRVINGYSGRGEVYLAMERGEVDGWASTIAGLNQPEQAKLVKSGKLIPIVNLGWRSPPDFPDLPNLSDYIKDPDVRAVFDFFLSPLESGRPLAVPKGVPEDRLAALRAAFDATVADPDFRAVMRSRSWSVEPISGAEVEAILEKLYGTSEETLRSVREVLLP